MREWNQKFICCHVVHQKREISKNFLLQLESVWMCLVFSFSFFSFSWLFVIACAVRGYSCFKKERTQQEPKKIGFSWRKQNFVSFHLFFLFCNSFAFSLFTRLPSTTTPPPTLSFLTRFQKKKTGICSNLNVLLCHPSITYTKKKQS